MHRCNRALRKRPTSTIRLHNIMIRFPSVTVSGLITAPCEKLFALVSDPIRHPELAGSGEVQTVHWLTDGPHGVGSGFAATQQVGNVRYPTRSFVQEWEAPYRFVWLSGVGVKRPPFGQLWGFDLQPLDGRTTWVSHMMKVPMYPMLKLPPFTWLADLGASHEARNMKPTLKNLARVSGAQLLGDIKVSFDWCDSRQPCGRVEEGTLRAA
jgi:hypothetical protein